MNNINSYKGKLAEVTKNTEQHIENFIVTAESRLKEAGMTIQEVHIQYKAQKGQEGKINTVRILSGLYHLSLGILLMNLIDAEQQLN